MAAAKKTKAPHFDTFDFQPGRILAKKYEVVSLLGTGWEGEVYKVRERATDIERAAKFFFPQRNPNDKALNFYARKLHKLQNCPIVIQYLTQEAIRYKGISISFLISEFCEGTLLSDFLTRQPGHRLLPFPALHLLHALASGIECIHHMGEYHGDLHTENIIIQRYGLGFDLRLLDLYHWGAPSKTNIHHDVIDIIRIFYDAMGGARYYSNHPQEIKTICRGLKRTLILKQFRSARQIREHLETMEWQ